MTRRHCLVPHCGRTTGLGDPNGEWICGKHWKNVPATMRRRLSRFARQYRRRFGDDGFWKYPPGSDKRIEAVRRDRLWRAMWKRCKSTAIERAVGIA